MQSNSSECNRIFYDVNGMSKITRSPCEKQRTRSSEEGSRWRICDGLTSFQILTLLNESSYPMPRLPPIDLDCHFATVEVCLNPTQSTLEHAGRIATPVRFRRIRKYIEPEPEDQLYSWNFDEQYVYSGDYKCLVVHRHQLDAMSLLKWVLDGLRSA
ncbi:hypothetical protein PRIPAC_92770, partial [Pristionchus pacificus]|uniref:Uncharacterized protein n=1 Tax=Pristionchus pacificus TaxID=54126 RepID=A0A2A6CDM9_PRIPA